MSVPVPDRRVAGAGDPEPDSRMCGYRVAPTMERRTVLAVALLVLALAGAGGYALAASGGTLTERWVSDTARANEVNHHAVGAGAGVVVAPVAARPGEEPIGPDSCQLVRVDAATGATRWARSVPADACFTHALTEPAIGDVDGDGAPEVVAASARKALLAYDADGTPLFAVDTSDIGYSRPTLADLDGDGTPEVVVADIDGQVTAVDGDGTVLWRHALEAGTFTAPVVADVDADGSEEVVVGTSSSIVALGPHGSVEWERDRAGEYLAVAQLDDDPALELLGSTTSGAHALDGRDGSVQWAQSFVGTPRVRAVGDGDGDGTPEAYLGVSEGRVVAVDATTGAREWETAVVAGANRTTPAPTLGDLTGDGSPELVAVGPDGTVVVLDPASGAELAAYERPIPLWTHATVADADGDGRTEVYVRYGDGRVVRLDYSAGGF